MKKLILLIAALALLVVPVKAQTNLPPAAGTIWDFVTATATNWYVAPFAIYDTDTQKVGGGIGLAYALDVPVVQDALLPAIRLDYINDSAWLMEGSLQLQLPSTVLGKFPVRPFGVVGIATPFAGAGSDNGNVVSILGAGAEFRFTKNIGAVADYEWWSGASETTRQVRAGIYFHF